MVCGFFDAVLDLADDFADEPDEGFEVEGFFFADPFGLADCLDVVLDSFADFFDEAAVFEWCFELLIIFFISNFPF